ncbi:hypothetical protein LOC54_11775 [Acetobacter sp. AN02]|uniref:hypothetical protein n=1 Tax=Acetobacter sp. AN02 TaxID=2894186 RepID=UPI002434111A|nr:hypothetical protein [Acetobacter sp. AN02]MDG6095749.1 hypothetical protein [Acetobacter sp. AN02]
MNNYASQDKSTLTSILDITTMTAAMTKYHVPGSQAADLGSTISPETFSSTRGVT